MSRLYADGSTEFVCQKPLGAKHLPAMYPQSGQPSRKCFAPTPRRMHCPNVLWSGLDMFRQHAFPCCRGNLLFLFILRPDNLAVIEPAGLDHVKFDDLEIG